MGRMATAWRNRPGGTTRYHVSMADHETWLRRAVDLALENVRTSAGGPFGAVVVKHGHMVAMGVNRVVSSCDPTSHAEIEAIRAACRALGSFQLDECTMYSSCEPCPMCLGALYWARPAAVWFASTRDDASAVGFDDSLVYEQLALPVSQRRIPMHLVRIDEYLAPFHAWDQAGNKVPY